MNIVILPTVNEILDAARLLEAKGIKFTASQTQQLIAACLNGMAQDIEFITEEVKLLNQEIFTNSTPASKAIN